MRKTILLIISLFVISLTVSARSISQAEAQSVAASFVNGMANKGTTKLKHVGAHQVKAAKLDATCLYGFNIDGGGYVLVSGDSRTYSVLGYADSGVIDTENMPANMREWIKGYDEAIKNLDAADIATSSAPVVTGDAVAPLLTTKWNQDAPYNNLCPTIPYGKGGTFTGYTGCVATAMAQVMYFHKWPQSASTELPAYDFHPITDTAISDDIISMEALPAKTFNWDAMLPEYGEGIESTAESDLAVAELMQYCGQSVIMTYLPYGSDAQEISIATALRQYFNYDKGTRVLFRSYYSIEQWENMIYDELKSNRPVPYAGQSGSGGHSFVVDGYDGNGLFHLNWGWGGMSDGYYRLSVLNPFNNSGIGSASGLMGYSFMQEAVIGVQPPTEGTEPCTQDIFFELGLGAPIKVKEVQVQFSFYYYSLLKPENDVIAAIGTKEGDTFIPLIQTGAMHFHMHDEQALQVVFTLNPDDFEDGETMLYFRAKPAEGDYDWFEIDGDENCLRLTKADGKLNIKVLPEYSLEITDVSVVGNDNPKVGDIVDVSINVKNNGDKEVNSYFKVMFYEMGAVELADQPTYMMPEYKPWYSGLYIRPGETDEILIKNRFYTPGNVAAILYNTTPKDAFAMGAFSIDGDEIPFYNISIEQLDLNLEEDGFFEYTVKLKNNDERDWDFPPFSNNYFLLTVGENEVVNRTYIPVNGSPELPFWNMLNFEDEAEAGVSSLHFTLEQVVCGRKQMIYETDLEFGQKITTGVEEIRSESLEAPTVWYNLQGIRIAKPTAPGLYIKNGKKVLIAQ